METDVRFYELSQKILDFLDSQTSQDWSWQELIVALELCKITIQASMINDTDQDEDEDEDSSELQKNVLSLTLDVKTLEPEINDSLCS